MKGETYLVDRGLRKVLGREDTFKPKEKPAMQRTKDGVF